MKKALILFCLLFVKTAIIFPQSYGNYVTQSLFGEYEKQKPFEFNSYTGSSQVNMFRGTYNKSIPIFAIEAGEFSFPISIDYSSSGFRLIDKSSDIGLGWELNVPGVITRNVRGIPDDSDYGGYLGNGGRDIFDLLLEGDALRDIDYFYSVEYDFWGALLSEIPYGAMGGAIGYTPDESDEELLDALGDLFHIAENYYDGLPDEFCYNTGLEQGKFVFERNGVIQQIPKTNNQIIFNNPDGNWNTSYFTIIDENGIQYLYDVVDEIDPTIGSRNNCKSDFKAGNYIQTRKDIMLHTTNGYPYVSAWHLSKIILPNNEEIIFSYLSEEIQYVSQVSESLFHNSKNFFDTPAAPQDTEEKYEKISMSATRVQENRNKISNITYKDILVNFNEENDYRRDLNEFHSTVPEYSGHALSNIEVFYGGNLLKRVNLYQTYFDCYERARIYNDASFLRLKLDSLVIINSDSDRLPAYNFSYMKDKLGNDDGALASYYDYSKDLWGYYKYQSLQTYYIGIPQYYIYPADEINQSFNTIYSIYPRNPSRGDPTVVDGRDMTPDIDRITQGMLRKIEYPTGGYDSIEYELNYFRFDGIDRPGPGVRVKAIHECFNIDGEFENVISTNYTYSNNDTSTGLVAELPQICQFDKSCWGDKNIPEYTGREFEWSTTVNGAVRNQKDTQVGYTKVTKEIINRDDESKNIKSEYTYAFPGDYSKYQDYYVEEIDDYLYKKPKSVLWGYCSLNALNYWEPGEVSQYINDYKMYDKNIDLLNPDFDWYRGKLVKESYFNSNNNLIKSIDYTYDIDLDYDEIFGIVAYNYFVFQIPEGTLIVSDGSPSGTYNVYTDIDLNQIICRWGCQSFISAFVRLKNKTITYYNGDEVVDCIDYQYSNNEPFANKLLLQNIKSNSSNGYIQNTTLKYTTDYASVDCYEVLNDDKRASYVQYLNNLDQQCFTGNVCYEFQYGNYQYCAECVSSQNSIYFSSLNDNYNDFITCRDEQVSTTDPVADAILRMSAFNNLRIIETQERIIKNDIPYLVSGSINSFKALSNGVIVKDSVIETNIVSPISNPVESSINSNNEFVYADSYYVLAKLFEKHDIYGNNTQMHNKDDIDITYLWGYNYSYPIAIIVNATEAQVLQELGISYDQLQTQTSAQLIVLFQNLINNSALPTSPLYNSEIYAYTYDPLIGSTSKITPDGKITTYSYDEFNRLETTKDHQNNIIEHREYHFQGE